MTTNHTPKSDVVFTEAPASWNTMYLTPEGFECQITLRAESGSELLEKAANAIAYLLKSGCLPYTYRPNQRPAPEPKPVGESNTNSNGTSLSHGNNANPAWCPIHQCEMKRWGKNGKVWYSHKIDVVHRQITRSSVHGAVLQSGLPLFVSIHRRVTL